MSSHHLRNARESVQALYTILAHQRQQGVIFRPDEEILIDAASEHIRNHGTNYAGLLARQLHDAREEIKALQRLLRKAIV